MSVRLVWIFLMQSSLSPSFMSRLAHKYWQVIIIFILPSFYHSLYRFTTTFHCSLVSHAWMSSIRLRSAYELWHGSFSKSGRQQTFRDHNFLINHILWTYRRLSVVQTQYIACYGLIQNNLISSFFEIPYFHEKKILNYWKFHIHTKFVNNTHTI